MSYGPLYDYDGELGSEWWGYFKLGPVRIPPIQPTVGMVDRAGSGQVWFLMWDAANHLLLTDELPASAQNVYVFGPYDGPYIGQTGWRLGVTTNVGFILGQSSLGGPAPLGGLVGPHLVVDVPGTFENSRWPSSAHPLIAPSVFGQAAWRVPESTGWPAPRPPVVPGIPSSSPVPTGGGYAAFEGNFANNSPPLVSSTFVPTSANVPQPWHLIFWAGDGTVPGGGGSGGLFTLGLSDLGGSDDLG
jgi:hypothetical protein